jgi:hypothetical protein
MELEVDKDSAQKILGAPPFVQVEGIINIRTLGGFTSSWPLPDSSSLEAEASPSGSRAQTRKIKSGKIFRAGDPSRVTEKGQTQLKELGVKKVFDFRGEREIKGFDSATPEIEGIEFVRVPISEDKEYDPVSLAMK